MTENNAPDRIWATVNGASTRLPDGARQLIGGWSEDKDRPRAVEYVRADLAQSLRSAQASQAGEVEVVAWMATESPDGIPDVTLRPDTADAWRADEFVVTPLITLAAHQSVIAAKDAANAALMAERSNLIETKRQQLAAKDAGSDIVRAQNEWLKQRIADLQLPTNQHHRRDDWLVECGMPGGGTNGRS